MTMRWVFEHENGRRVTYEVICLPKGGYEIRITYPDGTINAEQVEASGIDERSRDFRARLTALGWNLVESEDEPDTRTP